MKSCDDCSFGKRLYSDGLIYRNWSGRYTGDVKDLPKIPDPMKFWTYLECSKNNKGLKHVNLDGNCTVFSPKKN